MCGVCTRHPCACGIASAFLGCFCFFAAACATSPVALRAFLASLRGIYVRLTPLYSTISCTHASTQVENLRVGVPLISPTTLAASKKMLQGSRSGECQELLGPFAPESRSGQ